jgi:hypothetical protein
MPHGKGKTKPVARKRVIKKKQRKGKKPVLRNA